MNYEEPFQKIEQKWQKAWEKQKAFEPQVDKKQKKFFFTVPFPYTSGPLHIGHGRTYTIADAYVRFKRMQGLNVLWPMGFHITGTPILAVSRRIEQKDPEAIKTFSEYIRLYENNPDKANEILNSFVEPQKVADYFASVISSDFNSLGFSIDWSRSFTTGDKEYNKFIEWQFNRLRELDLITKGTHPVLYCVNDKNAVGEDDIQNGDTIDPGIEEYVLIKFKMGDTYLIAATFRPDTLFGATNIFLNPNILYVKFKVHNEKWIGSKEFFEKLSYQGKNPEKIETVSGFDLIGKNCVVPLSGKDVPILPGEFPNPEIGSGIVYSVPAHSVADYAMLDDLKKNENLVKKYPIDYSIVRDLSPIAIIKTPDLGVIPALDIFRKHSIKSQLDEKIAAATKELYSKEYHAGVTMQNCGEFSNMKVSEAREAIKKKLIEQKLGEIFNDVSALELPVKCRCGGKVVVSLLKDQWYINYGDEGWKENARKCFNKMKILPEMYKPLFDSTINWLHERACARMRGLGTKLPWDSRWTIESLSDSTIYPAFYTVINLIHQYKLAPEQLTQNFWNYVFSGAGKIKKIAKETKIKEKILKELNESFTHWYPNDLRHTAVGHITNHLTFYIFNHVALFEPKFWPKAITLNEFLIREGAKMSKSKGNVVPLVEIPRKYGADLYRIYILSGANLDAVMDWREKNVLSAQKRLNRFYELAEEIIKARKPQAPSPKPRTVDLWLKSRFNSVLKLATEDLENFRMRDYSQRVFFEFLNDISHYYQRAKGDLNYSLLKEILSHWLKILSPVIPHTAEEFWQKLGHKDFISLSEWPTANKKAIREDVESAEQLVQTVSKDIEQIITLTNKKPGKITIFAAPQWKYDVYTGVLMGKQIKDFMKSEKMRKLGGDVANYFNKLNAKKFELSKQILDSKGELKILSEAKEFFEAAFNCTFEIVPAENAQNPKAKAADVMKPGIYLE